MSAACRVLQARAELADPHVVSDIRDRRSIVDAAFDGLVRRGPDGRFAPWLAERWSVSPDGRRWTFGLRDGVRCHDGGALDARDAAASIRRALDPDLPGELGTQGVLRSYLEGTVAETPDALTLRLTLPAPTADLLDFLVDLPAVPERAFDRLCTAGTIGSGAFRVLEAAPGRVVMEPIAYHWAGGPPPAGRLVWEAEPDPAQRLARFRAGEAGWAVDPPRAAALGDPRLLRAPGHLCVIFLFNLFRGPATDPRVRRALHHALDVDALIRDPAVMAGAARPLAGPLTALHPGGAGGTPYIYDPDRAEALLAEAGYGSGLDLAVDLPARFPDEAVPLARALAAQWARVGVRCALRVHEDRPGYADRVRAKDIGDLCCFDSSPASAYRVLCEKLDGRRRGPWWMGYESPALDALIDAMGAESDEARRADLVARASGLVRADAPWLFLYAPDSLWLRAPGDSPLAPSAEGRLRRAMA